MNTDKIYAEAIANEYSVKKSSGVTALRKLDGKVKKPPKVLAITLGVIFTLTLGTGMCLAMGVIGEGNSSFMLGIALGLVGIAGVSVNYPIYRRFLDSRKSRYAGDIIELAHEISDSHE